MAQEGFLLPGKSNNSGEVYPDSSTSFVQIFNFDNASNTFWTVIIIILIAFAIFVICLFIAKRQRTKQEKKDKKKRLLGKKKRKQKKKKVYMFADPNDPNRVIYAKFNKKKGKYIPITCDAVMEDYNGLQIKCIDNQVFLNNQSPESYTVKITSKRKNKVKKLYVFHDSTNPNTLIYAKYNKKKGKYIPVKYENVCQNYNEVDMTYIDNITFQEQAGRVDANMAYAPPSETNHFY